MLRQLRIQNFKGWADTGPIRMAPITLFFGTNSSGKSSIGQFLMMLKQTAESPDRRAVFNPGGKSSAVQLGSYREMVYQRDPANKIAFEYVWDLDKRLDIRDAASEDTYTGDALSFEARVGLADQRQLSPVVHYLRYELLAGDQVQLAIGMHRREGPKSEYEVNVERYELRRPPGRAWPPKAPVRFYGFPDEVVAYYLNADFVQPLGLRHEQFLHSLAYLGPLRSRAERLYSWTGVEPESVGYSGESTVPAILAARGRTLNLRPKAHLRPFDEVIARELKKMGLVEEFRVGRVSEQREEYEVKLRARGSKDWVDLPDVGFGVSQVLPVLVQCFYAPPGSIIIMEQPEIHLHPRAQAALADVMIDTIKSGEAGTQRNIQLIIETHSEHFLRRLQRRIAEDEVPQDDVSAYFADISSTPAVLTPLDVDLFGNIRNWPEGFFGDEMEDMIAQSEAALEKRARQIELDRETGR